MSSKPTWRVERRKRIFVNDDPQRRCYDGCHFSYHYEWGPWETMDSGLPENAKDRRLQFWQSLNDYAVSQRGDGAKREYRLVKESEESEVNDA